MVVDGHHRVEAARSLGRTRIGAELYEGSDAEAYIEAVSRNIAHGCALTLSERKIAARRILFANLGFSDRKVAGLCGLSSGTVGKIRKEIASRPSGSNPAVLSAQPSRVEEYPPLRTPRPIKSDEHVHCVDQSKRTRSRAPQSSEKGAGELPLGRKSDSVLTAKLDVPKAKAPEFPSWFASKAIDAEMVEKHLEAVPLSRIYEIADEARRRSRFWAGFAETIDRGP
jgi:ParB-like chromosome segregation protein Spo0J